MEYTYLGSPAEGQKIMFGTMNFGPEMDERPVQRVAQLVRFDAGHLVFEKNRR